MKKTIDPCDYWNGGCNDCPFGKIGCAKWYSGNYSKENWITALKEQIKNCEKAIDNLNKI